MSGTCDGLSSKTALRAPCALCLLPATHFDEITRPDSYGQSTQQLGPVGGLSVPIDVTEAPRDGRCVWRRGCHLLNSHTVG